LDDVLAGFRELKRLERMRSAGGLKPFELERYVRIKRSLSRRFIPGTSDRNADARASVRVPMRLDVSFPSLSDLGRSMMTNLSQGGLFLECEHRVEIGTRLTLQLHLDDAEEELELPVEVVAHDTGPQLKADAHGMGVRFLDMSPETRARLDALYERAQRETAKL
jgi:uncharacterized protein (TIGR02266 family)